MAAKARNPELFKLKLRAWFHPNSAERATARLLIRERTGKIPISRPKSMKSVHESKTRPPQDGQWRPGGRRRR